MNFNKISVQKAQINEMLEKIIHRGPDYRDSYVDKIIGIGHCLLKIQDITDMSHQPFIFNKYVKSYNGEVYNYLELRRELMIKGYTFLTDGDTEVIIKAFDCWGLDAVSKFNGFFAIALFDKVERKLYLVRDRMGINHYTIFWTKIN